MIEETKELEAAEVAAEETAEVAPVEEPQATPIYNEMNEDKLREAVRLAKDSSLTKMKIAEMIGCKHEDVVSALAKYQNLRNRGVTMFIRKHAIAHVLGGGALKDFAEEAEVDYNLLVEALAPVI